MISSLFLFGIVAGSVLGVPVGPNGTLCLYRSIRFGWFHGMATALGSVSAMFLHAMLSFMLLSSIMGFISMGKGGNIIDTMSGAISIAIGIIFYFSPSPKESSIKETAAQTIFFRNFASSFAIGIVNPKNIFGFAALLIANNLALAGNLSNVMNAASFGTGVFLSTALLFMILIFLSITLGERFLSRFIPKLKYWVSAAFILTGFLKVFKIL